MRSYIERTKIFLQKHERRISVFALLAGFVVDSLTLTQIDRLYDNMVIISYLVIVGVGIFVVNLYNNGKVVGRIFSLIDSFFPIFISFAFGGLFSAFTVFYSRSTTFSGSWPFLLLLIGLLIGNEFLKKHYRIFTLQITLLFFVVYSYFIFIVPILLQKIGTIIFITSGILALFAIAYYRKIIKKFIPDLHEKTKWSVTFSIALVFIAVNILYIFNFIPPIPLSLKHIGVYHGVVRTNSGNYIVRSEPTTWFRRFFFTDVYNKTPGERAFVMSSVYAPVDLKVDIVHEWQKYNEEKSQWEKVFVVDFPVKGGRLEGYRGYSFSENPAVGLWRVNVKTTKGQIIGRQKFNIVEATGDINIVQETL